MQAILVGQAQIENHQIEAGGAQQRVGLCRRGGMGHSESLGFEPSDYAARDERVVFCQQYMHGSGSREYAAKCGPPGLTEHYGWYADFGRIGGPITLPGLGYALHMAVTQRLAIR